MTPESDLHTKWTIVLKWYQDFFGKTNDNTWYSLIIKSLENTGLENEGNRIADLNIDGLVLFSQSQVIPGEIIIENIYGLSLVLCQSYINEVIKQVKNFYNDYEAFTGKTASRITIEKKDILSNYGSKIDDSKYSKVEIINHLANYYKHREEWGSIIDSRNKYTIEAIQAIGGYIDMNTYWVQNLEKCIKRIGIMEVKKIHELIPILDDWKFSIRNAIVELK